MSRPQGIYLRIARASIRGAKDKVFKMIFPQNGKISQKLSLTLDMLPDAKLRAYKPDRTGSERIICIKEITRDKSCPDICVNEDF